MMPSILFYVPPSAEFLGPTTSQFSNQYQKHLCFQTCTPRKQVFKPDWRPWPDLNVWAPPLYIILDNGTKGVLNEDAWCNWQRGHSL